MVIMNAATSVITTRSPYIVRVSHTLPQDTQPMAQWAAKNGIKRVFTLVSDFGPGIDAETTFVKAFKAAGGEIVDSVRSPLSNNDFAPFLQRIKDSRRKRFSSSFHPAARRSASSRDTKSVVSSRPASASLRPAT
jgi:branched-chain amino acid transport system substrate-binding protein